MDLMYMVARSGRQRVRTRIAEQLSGWIRENRLKAEQEIKRSDMQHWAAANAFEELKSMFCANRERSPHDWTSRGHRNGINRKQPRR